MKRIAAALLYLILGVSFAQPNNDLETVKKRALESALAVLTRPIDGYPPKFVKKGCSLQEKKLYAGKPVFIRSLVHPTVQDRQRLRRRIEEARAKDPDFADATETGSFDPYKDYYRIRVSDRVCGYLFHIELEARSLAFGRITSSLSLTRQEAQRRLASAAPPTLVRLMALNYWGDSYMWLSGSEMIESGAYGTRSNHAVYRILDRSGKSVSPLETRLELHIFKRPFVTSMGEPSAFWSFQLPVRLEPLPPSPR